MNKKILIIGKKSFIGINLLKFFIKKRLKVHSISFENFIKYYDSFDNKFDFIIETSDLQLFLSYMAFVRIRQYGKDSEGVCR